MATSSYDTALDFLPEAKATPRPVRRGILANIAAVVRALGDGLDAQRTYKLQVSRGMSPAEAAKAAFNTHLKAN